MESLSGSLRIKTRCRTVVVLLAVALLLVGCDGGETEPQPPQAEAGQEESIRQPQPAPEETAQELAEPQWPSAPARQAANEPVGSDEAGDGASPALRAQACDTHPFAAEAERAAASAAQSDEAGGDAEREYVIDEERLELAQAASEAMRGWLSQLETLTLEASLIFDWDGRCAQLAVDTAIQVDPLAAWSVGDYAPWFEYETGLLWPESEQPLQMQDYLYEGRAYSTVTGLGGWGPPRWHYPHDDIEGVIHQWFGVQPSAFASYRMYGDGLACAAHDGGEIVEDRYKGEAVWVVTCGHGIESLLPFKGVLPDPYDAPLLRVAQVTISQATGAPLIAETRRAVADGEGGINWTVGRIVLTGWNVPVDLPTPEPLVDAAEFDQLVERLQASATAPERQLELAERWLSEQVNRPWQQYFGLTIGTALRTDSMRLSETRFQDSFEREVSVKEPQGNRLVRSVRLRQVCNRDGFWVSDADVDGEPVWTASTPAAHGFGQTTLDEVLAERSWIDLELFRDMLDVYEPTVHPPSDDWSTEYGVWIVGHPLEPGDAHFDQVVALLDAALAELGLDEVEVTRVILFYTSFRIEVESGQLTLQSAFAEFLTDAGVIKLSLEVDYGIGGRAFEVPSSQ